MTDLNACIVHTTCPDRDTAEALAKALVERRLAACVSIGQPVSSRFPWKGRVEYETEVPLTIKTLTHRLGALENTLADLHPYEVPEMLAVPIVWGHGPYMEWMKENLDE